MCVCVCVCVCVREETCLGVGDGQKPPQKNGSSKSETGASREGRRGLGGAERGGRGGEGGEGRRGLDRKSGV